MCWHVNLEHDNLELTAELEPIRTIQLEARRQRTINVVDNVWLGLFLRFFGELKLLR